MPDYSKGKIYNIVCNLTGDTYYGSTTQAISQRMNVHRKPGKSYCCSNPIIERGDYHYGLVEDYKCDNLEQLLMRERYYIDNNNCVNNRRPILSKDEKLAYIKVYNDAHKEKNKIYREANKDKIKAYHKENKEKKLEYYHDNKDKISEYRKQRVVCECGCELSKCCLTRHRKSKFHQEFMESLGSGGNTI